MTLSDFCGVFFIAQFFKKYVGDIQLNNWRCYQNTKESEVIVIGGWNNWWEISGYSFCKLPKAFIENTNLIKLSDGAKLLYAVLLDRMHLSASNNRRDKAGEVYINYSNKELCMALNWSHDKVTKKLKELENVKLIRRRKQKLGKSDCIYVLPFLPLCELSAIQSADNQDYGVQEISTTECKFSASNKTDSNKTNFNNIHLSIKGYDEMVEIIKENIEYEILSERDISEGQLDNIVALIADVCCGTSPTVRIGGNDYPRDMVRKRFMALNGQHIKYVIWSMDGLTSDIGNIRAYLLTTLFNAPVTVDSYWKQRALHDMPQLARK